MSPISASTLLARDDCGLTRIAVSGTVPARLMTAFLLMRHGEPDFSGLHALSVSGWPVDIGPLSASGERQVVEQIPQIEEFAPEVIVSSPVTRALHTAAVILSQVHVPFKVAFPLYDWLPDLRFQRLTMDQLRERSFEYNSLQGEWPQGDVRPWETTSMMRSRVLSVLEKYTQYRRVLVVSHQEPIRCVTGKSGVGLAELVSFDFPPA
jgi:broad specificity phosphatase PhoE